MEEKCPVSPSEGWARIGLEGSVQELDCLLSGKDVRFTSESGKPLELKVCCSAHNKRLKSLDISCNARFMEVYAVKDTLSKYVATVRGTNATSESGAPAQPNMFSMSLIDDTCEFRELQLRFLSIKPLTVITSDAASAKSSQVEFSLSSIALQYEKLADTPAQAPLVQQGGPGIGSGAGVGGMGGGGADLLGLMAMSMMGMAGGGGGAGPGAAVSGGGRAGGMPGMPNMGGLGMMAALLGSPAGASAGAGGGAQMRMHVAGGGTSQASIAPVSVPVSAPVPEGTRDGSDVTAAEASLSTAVLDHSTTSACNENSTSSTQNTQMNNTPLQASAPPALPIPRAPAATQAPRSAPAAAPAIDYAQLASILWTVKGSIVDDISQLIDKKLAPVIARLDRIDAQVEKLNSSVVNASNTNSCNSNDVGSEEQHSVD